MKHSIRILLIFSLLLTLACEEKKETESSGGSGTSKQDNPPSGGGGGSGGSGSGSQGGSGNPSTPAVNTPPRVFDANLLVKQGMTLSVTPQGQDDDGDILIYSVETQPTHGTISLSNGTFSYTADSTFVGIDQFTYKASDSIDTSAPATVKIFIMNGQVEASFWLRAEDIQAVGSDGDPIADWKDAISGNSAHFEDADRTPRLVSQLAPGVKGVHFEFAPGAGATNDFMSYPNTYTYSAGDGLTFIAVGESLTYSDPVAPVFSFGNWHSEGLGFNWNSTHVGVVTPTAHGGADDKEMLSVASGGLSIFVSQIRFSSLASNNGFQRARLNGGSWPNADTTLGVTKVSAAEIAEQATASTNGSPIMIGANNHFATQPNQRFAGKLGEVIVMNRFLSNSELKVIESHLKAKFKIP